MTSPKSVLDLFQEKKCVNVCAPMVRYSKLPFRELVRQYQVDLAYTPMILADVFRSSDFARDSDFTTNATDTPLVIQFAANNGKDLADATELAAPWVGGVDVNCGCPQKWAIHERIGSHLMSDPEAVRDMIRTVKGRMNIPCSVKIRVHDNLNETLRLVQLAEAAGIDFLAVHGRTRRQKSTVPPNLSAIKFLKENAHVPVIANGDVFSTKDVERVREFTGCDGVMAARGILRNPALFAGHEVTPWKCVEEYVRLSIGYGTNFFIFHHHIMYMLETVMSNAERKTFNVLSSIPAVIDHLEGYWGLDLTKK